jgi:sirohydrochlorin cobaltochelatase
MNTALILFAHGARDPEWARPLRRVEAAIRQRVTSVAVELAFLEFLTPTLTDSVAKMAAEGVEKIAVLPMFIAAGGHLKRELPEMIERLRAIYPDIEFVQYGAIGEHERVIQAIATASLEVAGLPLA